MRTLQRNRKNKLEIIQVEIVGGYECKICKNKSKNHYTFRTKLPEWTRCENCLDAIDKMFMIVYKERKLRVDKVICN